MANTISNMKMSNPIKNFVSKKRKRYIQDGFDLDLTYIRDNLIAMGFPAEKLEGVYRNHIDDVVKFLESKHKDHYKIYNLCSERTYDISKFQSRVATYPFDDHNPPRVELIRPFCADVGDWLIQDSNNVAAVHCKAGKGRTGVMICCYMLHAGLFVSADDALGYYGQMRTHDRKGVTIPSQRRYVGYYAQLLRDGLTYEPTSISVHEIRLDPPPLFSSQASYQFTISDSQNRIYISPVLDFKKNLSCLRFTIEQDLSLTGDIKVEFFNKPKMKRKEKLFHFWFNTFFVRDTAPSDVCTNGNDDDVERSGRAVSCEIAGRNVAQKAARAASLAAIDTDRPTLVLHLHKSELDNAHKDKNHKMYPPNFNARLFFHKLPLYAANTMRPVLPAPPLVATPSESSEAESSDCSTPEEDGWDSGETTYL